MSSVYIHIGMPKTATTLLQKHVFPHLSQFNYVDKYEGAGSPSQRLIWAITDQERLEYDVCRVREEANRLSDGRPLLVSEETLATGSWGSGRVDRAEIARRLYELFPDARLCLCIRRQEDILLSQYRQLRSTRYVQAPTVDQWLDQEWVRLRYAESAFQYYNYAQLLALYGQYFSAEQISVMVFETLKQAPTQFLEALLQWLQCGDDETLLMTLLGRISDTRENESPSVLELRLRTIARQFPRATEWLRPFLGAALKRSSRRIGPLPGGVISAAHQDSIRKHYAPSNQSVSVSHGLSLEAYDYAC